MFARITEEKETEERKKSISALFLCWPEDYGGMEKKKIGGGGGGEGASYSTSNKFLLVARHTDYGPSKMPLKLAL